MAQITQTVFVHYDTYRHADELAWGRWSLNRWESKHGDEVFVCKAEVTFEVPDDFDPRPVQIKALEAKKRELQAQFSAAVTELNRQISELQAIEHTEAA